MFVLQTLMFYRSIFGFQGTLTSGSDFCSDPCHRGGKGIRTPDPLLAGQVLSQLSYTPIDLAATCSPMPSPA